MRIRYSIHAPTSCTYITKIYSVSCRSNRYIIYNIRQWGYVSTTKKGNNRLNNKADFYKWFDGIASKLGDREVSFRKIFNYLDSKSTPIIIVETGCLRELNNFQDGQSTFTI